MEHYAPVLLNILNEATKPPKIRKNQFAKQVSRALLEYANKQNAIITTTTAILCKNCRPMCLFQKIISLILQAGRSSKQVRMKSSTNNSKLVTTVLVSTPKCRDTVLETQVRTYIRSIVCIVWVPALSLEGGRGEGEGAGTQTTVCTYVCSTLIVFITNNALCMLKCYPLRLLPDL